MEFKGTKGGWKVKDSSITPTICTQDENVRICNITKSDSQTEKANAQLISAAPELLEALKRLVRTIKAEGLSKDILTARAEQAINKALGK